MYNFDKEKDLWDSVNESMGKETLELGPYYTNHLKNMRHLLISFSRYKFAARIIGDIPKKTVLELGCNEGLGTLNLSQIALKTVGVDFDEAAIAWAKNNLENENLSFINSNFLGNTYGEFDTIVSLDVIEHLQKANENVFLETIYNNLNEQGVAIVGTPNITASAYASEASKIGHINLYDAQRLKDLFLTKFRNVFIFGMNDEVVHTGFLNMCHYIFVVACNKY